MGSNKQSFVSQNKKNKQKDNSSGVFEVSPHAWRITNVHYAGSELHFLTNNNQIDFAPLFWAISCMKIRGMLHCRATILFITHGLYYTRISFQAVKILFLWSFFVKDRTMYLLKCPCDEKPLIQFEAHQNNISRRVLMAFSIF